MEANEYQIGGNHYQGEYQHWDFVCDTDSHYLLGCATKYIARWRKKNGIQDLRKASHYLTKAEDRGIYVIEEEKPLIVRLIEKFLSVESPTTAELWFRFSQSLEPIDRTIMSMIFHGDYEQARALISDLILEEEGGPTQNYVDPDNNYFRG